MNWATILEHMATSGPMGLVCVILLWRDVRREDRRDELDRERLKADKDLAAAMTLLAERIRALG